VVEPDLRRPAGAPPPDEPDAAAPHDADRSWVKHRRGLIEWGIVILAVVVLTLVARTYILEAYYIPSASMETTLKPGDRVLVDKLSYDLHGVGRGNIVVFHKPSSDIEGPSDLIKRVIGLPGETISAQGGYIYINGKRLNESWLPAGARGDTCAEGTSVQQNNCGAVPPVHIPKGDYFVMGDNRTDSEDSRVFGPIPSHLIVGKAFVLIWPVSRWTWF
jgi:signal peptidase I